MKFRFLIAPLLFSSLSFAGPAETNRFCPDISTQIGRSGNFINFDGTLRIRDPSYNIVGTSFQLRSEERERLECIDDLSVSACNSLGSTLIDLAYDGDNVDFVYSRNGSLLPNSGGTTFTRSETYSLPSRSRGTESVGVGAVVRGSGPYCEFNTLYWQNAPTISAKSISLTNIHSPITASVNATYDTSYSRSAIEGVPVKYTWIFQALSAGGTYTVETSVPSVSYAPPKTSDYRVRAIINDGTFTRSVTFSPIPYYQSRDNGGILR